MTNLKQHNVSKTIKKEFKNNKNMAVMVSSTVQTKISKVDESLYRGKLLMYSQYIDAVKENIKSLKTINSKYINVTLKIINTSITENQALDVEINLDQLLSQLNFASYNNHEILDFTEEILDHADNLTAKYYLAVISNGLLKNTNLKKQFKSAKSFVKILLSSFETTLDLTMQKQFVDALSIIINEKADYKKIELLPKIKYTVDSISKKSYDIDITRILYNSPDADTIKDNLKRLQKNIKTLESENENFDVTDYLTKN